MCNLIFGVRFKHQSKVMSINRECVAHLCNALQWMCNIFYSIKFGMYYMFTWTQIVTDSPNMSYMTSVCKYTECILT